MRISRLGTAVLILAGLFLSAPVQAGPRMPAPPDGAVGVPATRPRVGLVLSSGGALGLAHIGVLKVLEEAGVHVDVVVGTSIGSIIGALYAVGYTPEQIERVALAIDWNDLFNDRLPRNQLPMKNRKKDDRYLLSLPVVSWRPRLPAGLVAGENIYSLFVELTWPYFEVDDFKELPKPYACVATDISTGESVVLDHGYLPDAIKASMSIPSIFTPVSIDGRLLVDGGLVNKLPAEVARKMGADILIGVDVSGELLPAEKLDNLVGILNQTIDVTLDPGHQAQKRMCNVLIMPHTDGYGSRDYSKARDLIRLGGDAAREHFAELRSIADSLAALGADQDSLGAAKAPATCPLEMDGSPIPVLNAACFSPIRIEEIEVRGLRDVSSRFVLAELDIRPPAFITADELKEAVQRLYSSGFFTDIRYRFEQVPAGRKLVIAVQENSGTLLNLGLRYDSESGAALLMNASLKNLIEHASSVELDVLLGERKRIVTEYAIYTGIRRSAGLRLDLDYLDDHINMYEGKARVSRWRTRDTRGGFFLETLLSRVFYAAAGLNVEYFVTSPDIGPLTLRTESGHVSFASGDLWYDTLDRSWFPRRGAVLRIRGEAAGTALSGDAVFRREMLTGQISIPVERRVTVTGNIFVGLTHGRAPIQDGFFVGGINTYAVFESDRTYSFYGFRPQELSGPNAFMAGLHLQIEPVRGWYVIAHGNIGSAEQSREDLLTKRALHTGGALTLGVATPAGPAALSLTYSERNNLGWFLSVGFVF